MTVKHLNSYRVALYKIRKQGEELPVFVSKHKTPPDKTVIQVWTSGDRKIPQASTPQFHQEGSSTD